MRRKMKQKEANSDQSFLNRIYGLPVMTTAMEQLSSLYLKTKEKNKLIEMTMDATEAGIHLAYNTALPVVGKFDKQINLLNEAACNQLDKLEEKFPVISKPTDEVMRTTLDYGHSFVEPVISKVASAKDYGMQKVTRVTDQASRTLTYGGQKLTEVRDLAIGTTFGTAAYGCTKAKEVVFATGSYGIAKVQSVKDYGVEKVNEAKNKVGGVITHGVEKIENVKNLTVERVSGVAAYGSDKMTNNRLSKLIGCLIEDGLDVYEVYLDYCLPPEEGEETKESEKENVGLVGRSIIITDKAQRRISGKVVKEILWVLQKYKNARDVTYEKLGNVTTYAVSLPRNLANGVTAKVNVAKETASDLIRAADTIKTKTEGVVDGAKVTYDCVNTRLHNTYTHLKQLEKYPNQFLNTGKEYLHKTGQIVSYLVYLPKNRYNATKDKIYFIWTEVSKPEEEVLRDILEDKSANHSPDSTTLEKRFIATTRHVLQKAKWMSEPVMEFVQVSRKQVDEFVNHLKKNAPEFTVENVINTSFIQVSVAKPNISKLASDTYVNSTNILNQIYAVVWDLTLGKLFNGHLEAEAAMAIEEIPLARNRVTPDESYLPELGQANHEELRAIDDVTTEEEEEEEEEDGDDDVEASDGDGGVSNDDRKVDDGEMEMKDDHEDEDIQEKHSSV